MLGLVQLVGAGEPTGREQLPAWIRWTMRCAFILVAVLLATASCGSTPSLPAAPSDLESGVVVYENANYQGESAYLAQSIPDLREFNGPCEHDTGTSDAPDTTYDWNDCISSIRVAAGTHAIAYRDPRYQGPSIDLGPDAPNLQLAPGSCSHEGLNDCISSIRLVSVGQM